MSDVEADVGATIRAMLPGVRSAVGQLPTISAFRAASGTRPGRIRFEEYAAPNWWQIPRLARQDTMLSESLDEMGRSFEAVRPFCDVIGKRMSFPTLGTENIYESGYDIAAAILVAYLNAAGAERWRRSIFTKVWKDFRSLMDSSVETVEYVAYAPIVGRLSGVRRSFKVDGEFSIERLSPDRVAALGTLDPRHLAGVTLRHRFTLWPMTFLVRRLRLQKMVTEAKAFQFGNRGSAEIVSAINEEAALLRALLSSEITLPALGILPASTLRSPHHAASEMLPWRVRDRLPAFDATGRLLRDYRRLRSRLLAASQTPGWPSAMESIRRFAAAWDKTFRADSLADIVAALEQLLVRSDREVSYKLRVRAVSILGATESDRGRIFRDLRDAYSYRSKVFHGGYVFDDAREKRAAERMKQSKGKGGNPFHHVNEVNRLIGATSKYYRAVLTTMIEREWYDRDWGEVGL